MSSRPIPGTIRPARTADRSAIVAAARASGLLPAEGLAEVEATLDGFLAGTAEADRWLVDEGEDGVRAVAYYAPERLTDGTWNLHLLAVHPDHQGRGHGAALVRHVEDDLRRAGARVLLIETSGVPGFARQRAFYARLGYVQEARIREFYEPGDDKVVYWKHLVDNEPTPGRASDTDGPAAQPRVARAGDLPALLDLADAFYREDGFTTSRDALERNLRHLLASDAAHVALAEPDGRPVGFAVTTTGFGLENGLVAELEDLYVTPGDRRRGWAGRLVEDAARWAAARGATALEVVTSPNGEDMGHLDAYYEARGFADEGRRLRTRPLPDAAPRSRRRAEQPVDGG